MQRWMNAALAMPAAVAENPFGPESICIRIGAHGPIFALFMPQRGWVSFRCEKEQAILWRSAFPDQVRRGYHCPPSQQPYNNTIILDGSLPNEVLQTMLAHSYQRAFKSLPRARQAEMIKEIPDRFSDLFKKA